jgi:hypothetical protein
MIWMRNLGKIIPLLVVFVLAVPSLLIIQPANAQTIPKPSVPDFTLKYVDNSYDVPATVSTPNPYTNETTILPGYHVSNKSIEVIITNQPFAYSNNDSTYHLYYNVQSKPHFGGNWTERYPLIVRPNSPYNWDNKSWSYSKYLTNEFYSPLPSQPNAEYTIVSYDLNGDNYYDFSDLPSNAQIDFQVEAIVGHDSQAWYIQHPFTPEYGGFYEPAIAYDADSGWSNTQTVSIPDGNVTVSAYANPTPTPSVPELSFITILLMLLLMLSVAGISKLTRKRYDVHG